MDNSNPFSMEEDSIIVYDLLRNAVNSRPDEYGQVVYPYSAWVRVWRCQPAAELAAELIADNSVMFGPLVPATVNLAVVSLLEVLDASETRAKEWGSGIKGALGTEQVHWLNDCVKILADQDRNRCWNMVNDEHKSVLLVRVAVS